MKHCRRNNLLSAEFRCQFLCLRHFSKIRVPRNYLSKRKAWKCNKMAHSAALGKSIANIIYETVVFEEKIEQLRNNTQTYLNLGTVLLKPAAQWSILCQLLNVSSMHLKEFTQLIGKIRIPSLLTPLTKGLLARQCFIWDYCANIGSSIGYTKCMITLQLYYSLSNAWL